MSHGTRCGGDRRHARDRRGDLQGAEAAGYKVAANYGGNDEAAQKFKAETGIAVYKWDVSSYEACTEGLEAGRGRARTRRNSGQQCRHHARRHVPPHEAGAMATVINTNLNSLFNMCRPVIEGMRDAQVRPHHQHLLDQRAEGPDRPDELFRRQSRRTRLHQGAGAGERARAASR